jgi:di/tricarboxylate transporter
MDRHMKKLLQLLAAAGLVITILPPLLYFGGAIDHDAVYTFTTWGTVLWFAGAIPGRPR